MFIKNMIILVCSKLIFFFALKTSKCGEKKSHFQLKCLQIMSDKELKNSILWKSNNWIRELTTDVEVFYWKQYLDEKTQENIQYDCPSQNCKLKPHSCITAQNYKSKTKTNTPPPPPLLRTCYVLGDALFDTPQKRNHQLENCLHEVSSVCRAFSWSSIDDDWPDNCGRYRFLGLCPELYKKGSWT